MKATADTGLIVAFVNRTDRFHPWAMDIAKSITEALLTCEAVLAEAAFHLRSATYVLSLIENGMLRIAFDRNGSNDVPAVVCHDCPAKPPTSSPSDCKLSFSH